MFKCPVASATIAVGGGLNAAGYDVRALTLHTVEPCQNRFTRYSAEIYGDSVVADRGRAEITW